jgi:hypothetical protein
VGDFISDLSLSGIRFTYFSAYGERQSKVFADRLGLETDWNSCILLSDADYNDGPGYQEDHDIKAKLPRGIDEVKQHLAEVDDIPLHVSLFADCSTKSVKDMIHIFESYGETVCVLGSILNPVNATLFSVADVSVGVEPFRTRLLRLMSTQGKMNAMRAGATLNAIPCALFLQYDTSPFILLQAAGDARRLVGLLKQACPFTRVTIVVLLLFTDMLWMRESGAVARHVLHSAARV